MRILIAPDSFKGSLRADQVAQAIANGIKRSRPNATITLLPLADGGEGTLEVLASVYSSAEWKTLTVSDPLGRSMQSQWLWLPKTKEELLLWRDAGHETDFG